MKRLIGIIFVIAAIAGLGIWQYSVSKHLEAIEATLGRFVATNECTNRDDDQPRVTYQIRGGGLTKEELRAILRDELQGLRGAAAPAPEEAPAKPTPAAASPESVAAFQNAQRLVQNTLSTRVWGEKEMAEMRALAPQLTAEQLQSIQSTLLPAVNSQQIRVQVQGPLF